ncbi:hypothetical protein LCGC14_0866960 [marine sediment metagenome]|uniref:Uncharacterized protein n=1 Tax=marine sediment metagenome TaxID=412755 RepID=A0A0F9RQD4_9ZZZZ
MRTEEQKKKYKEILKKKKKLRKKERNKRYNQYNARQQQMPQNKTKKQRKREAEEKWEIKMSNRREIEDYLYEGDFLLRKNHYKAALGQYIEAHRSTSKGRYASYERFN